MHTSWEVQVQFQEKWDILNMDLIQSKLKEQYSMEDAKTNTTMETYDAIEKIVDRFQTKKKK